jgi:preprotein translocase subunit SecB
LINPKETTMADTDQAGASAEGGAGFSIEKIYVKDLSLENPGAPLSFRQQEAPQVEVGLRTSGEQIEPDLYESVVTITLTAKTGDKTLFLVEATQAGIFTIRGVPQDQMQGVLAVTCPTVIFPYLRETLADAVSRAGFPPVHLAPINFDALYAQQMAQVAPQAAAPN